MFISFNELLKTRASKTTVFIISKLNCPFCHKVKKIFDGLNVKYDAIEIDQEFEMKSMNKLKDEMQNAINARTVPQVFINQKHIGDSSYISKLYASGELQKILQSQFKTENEYKLGVIGGGSGGLAAVKQAAKLSPANKFIVFDYVSPTPNILGTKWGIGGCCVNVGCIPKKLFHKAGLIGHGLTSSKFLSASQNLKCNWEQLRSNINMYIKSLNFGTKSEMLGLGNITYINAKAKLTGPNEITYTADSGEIKKVTVDNALLATGTRPSIPSNLYSLKEHLLTSDDLFWCPYEPQDTLIVGGGYVALECACFLASIGFKVTLIVRDIALRSFDRECCDMILKTCSQIGIDVHLKTSIEEIELLKPADLVNNKAGLFRVKTVSNLDGSCPFEKNFNTVLVATGRYAETSDIYDESAVPIEKNPINGKIYAKNEGTNVPNVYTLGDTLDGGPELTPVAIAAGRRLANRLLLPEKANDFINYNNVATTIFTHDEFATVGLSEEKAIADFGSENIIIYRTGDRILENSSTNVKFGKMICINDESKRVVGIHFIGSDIGELIQSYSLMLQKGLSANSMLNHPDFIWIEQLKQSPIKKSQFNDKSLEPGKYAVLI